MPEYKWPPMNQRRIMGKSVNRVDGPVKASGKAKYREYIEHSQILVKDICGLVRPAHEIQNEGPSGCKGPQSKQQIHEDRVRHILPKIIQAVMKGKSHDLGCVNLDLGQDKKSRIQNCVEE